MEGDDVFKEMRKGGGDEENPDVGDCFGGDDGIDWRMLGRVGSRRQGRKR